MTIVKPKIFISHSTSDTEVIQKLRADLSRCGVVCMESDSAKPAGKDLSDFRLPDFTVFFSYVTPNYLGSSYCMEELQTALKSGSLKPELFADSSETIKKIPKAIRDEVPVRVLRRTGYWDVILGLSGRAWAALQIAGRLVPAEDHILAGPAIFDSQGFRRADLLKRVNNELILAAANLRSWLSDADSRKGLVDLVKSRGVQVTLILATYETLRPISEEGATHLRHSVEDIKGMLGALTPEERPLMRAFFHKGASTLSAVFIDPESSNGILFFNPRWAIQFVPQDRLTCVIDKSRNSPTLFKALYNSVLLMTQRDAKSLEDMLPGKTVFISYRRSDSADITGRLTDKLIQKFGNEAVFKDVDSIISGSEFKFQIDHAVKKCDVFIAMIGRGWFGPPTGDAATRLENPHDFVRLEVEAALGSGVPVIPVLVQGASVPEEHALPVSLRGLALKQGIFLHGDPDFHRDSDRLIRDIETHFRGQPDNR